MNEILETKTPVKNAYHLFPLLAPSPPLPSSINQFHVPDLPELIPRESLVCVGSFYRHVISSLKSTNWRWIYDRNCRRVS